EHVLQPGRPDSRVGVVCQHRAGQREHPIADHQHVKLADPQRVARRNQLVEPRPTGIYGVVHAHDFLLLTVPGCVSCPDQPRRPDNDANPWKSIVGDPWSTRESLAAAHAQPPTAALNDVTVYSGRSSIAVTNAIAPSSAWSRYPPVAARLEL